MFVKIAANFRGWYGRFCICLIGCLRSSACAATPALQSESLISTPVQPTPPPGREAPWPLELPPGYRISLYAQGLEEVRSIAFNPDGVPYVTVMNRDQAFGGKVLALPDADGDGWAERTVTVAESLDRPHGIMFHEGQLYVSEAGNLFRMHDVDGDMILDTRESIVTEMPTRGDHWSRPFVFTDDGAVLVAIGSSCNACQEGDKQRATILWFDPNTTTVYPDTTAWSHFLRRRTIPGGSSWRYVRRLSWCI
jgi:glucose/arabinose dehydrogenase